MLRCYLNERLCSPLSLAIASHTGTPFPPNQRLFTPSFVRPFRNNLYCNKCERTRKDVGHSFEFPMVWYSPDIRVTLDLFIRQQIGFQYIQVLGVASDILQREQDALIRGEAIDRDIKTRQSRNARRAAYRKKRAKAKAKTSQPQRDEKDEDNRKGKVIRVSSPQELAQMISTHKQKTLASVAAREGSPSPSRPPKQLTIGYIKGANEHSPFINLPLELLIEIVSHVPLPALGHLALTCRCVSLPNFLLYYIIRN